MAVISGINGNILIGTSEIADVAEWTLTMNANNSEFGSSDTGGHSSTVLGRKNGTVSFEVKYNNADELWRGVTGPALKIGDQVTLLLREETGADWQVPVRIESMELAVPIEDADVITLAVEAQCHGAWTYPDLTQSS